MRLNYSDDEDYPGQFNIFQANCRRSLRGKAGQRELRELEAALLALPTKRLIHGALTDDDGGVCAIACYAKHKGVDLSTFDPDANYSDEVGIAGGMPRLVAWKVVEQNDFQIDGRWIRAEGPAINIWGHRGPDSVWMEYTPEERYEKVLAWVRSELRPSVDAVGER